MRFVNNLQCVVPVLIGILTEQNSQKIQATMHRCMDMQNKNGSTIQATLHKINTTDPQPSFSYALLLLYDL